MPENTLQTHENTATISTQISQKAGLTGLHSPSPQGFNRTILCAADLKGEAQSLNMLSCSPTGQSVTKHLTLSPTDRNERKQSEGGDVMQLCSCFGEYTGKGS